MDLTLLMRSVSIMFIGMGTVFFFLIIMIFTMILCGKIIIRINKIFPEKENKNTNKTKIKTQNEDESIAIAVACAFAQSKKN